jgi:DNA-binding phage protein
MGAISMKVNPAFVSILIIATSFAIHLSTHIQPSHWL